MRFDRIENPGTIFPDGADLYLKPTAGVFAVRAFLLEPAKPKPLIDLGQQVIEDERPRRGGRRKLEPKLEPTIEYQSVVAFIFSHSIVVGLEGPDMRLLDEDLSRLEGLDRYFEDEGGGYYFLRRAKMRGSNGYETIADCYVKEFLDISLLEKTT